MQSKPKYLGRYLPTIQHGTGLASIHADARLRENPHRGQVETALADQRTAYRADPAVTRTMLI